MRTRQSTTHLRQLGSLRSLCGLASTSRRTILMVPVEFPGLDEDHAEREEYALLRAEVNCPKCLKAVRS